MVWCSVVRCARCSLCFFGLVWCGLVWCGFGWILRYLVRILCFLRLLVRNSCFLVRVLRCLMRFSVFSCGFSLFFSDFVLFCALFGKACVFAEKSHISAEFRANFPEKTAGNLGNCGRGGGRGANFGEIFLRRAREPRGKLAPRPSAKITREGGTPESRFVGKSHLVLYTSNEIGRPRSPSAAL